MPFEYLWGLLTIPALLLTLMVLAMAHATATWVWKRLHNRLVLRIKLHLDTSAAEERIPAAQNLVDQLVRAPHFRMLQGFGWTVLFVREYNLPKEQ